jgi:ferredoxin
MTSTSKPKAPEKKEQVHRVLLGKKQILVTEDEPLLVQLERAGIHVE